MGCASSSLRHPRGPPSNGAGEWFSHYPLNSGCPFLLWERVVPDTYPPFPLLFSQDSSLAPLHAARAVCQDGSVRVGKCSPAFSPGCLLPYNASELTVSSYEVCLGAAPGFSVQMSPCGSTLPLGAAPVGHLRNGLPVYLGVVQHSVGGVACATPGSVIGCSCFITLHGRVVRFAPPSFSVLCVRPNGQGLGHPSPQPAELQGQSLQAALAADASAVRAALRHYMPFHMRRNRHYGRPTPPLATLPLFGQSYLPGMPPKPEWQMAGQCIVRTQGMAVGGRGGGSSREREGEDTGSSSSSSSSDGAADFAGGTVIGVLLTSDGGYAIGGDSAFAGSSGAADRGLGAAAGAGEEGSYTSYAAGGTADWGGGGWDGGSSSSSWGDGGGSGWGGDGGSSSSSSGDGGGGGGGDGGGGGGGGDGGGGGGGGGGDGGG